MLIAKVLVSEVLDLHKVAGQGGAHSYTAHFSHG